MNTPFETHAPAETFITYATPPKPAWDTTHNYGAGAYSGHDGYRDFTNTDAAAANGNSAKSNDEPWKGENSGWAGPPANNDTNNVGPWDANKQDDNNAWENNAGGNTAANDNPWTSDPPQDSGNNKNNWNAEQGQGWDGGADNKPSWDNSVGWNTGNVAANQSSSWDDDNKAKSGSAHNRNETSQPAVVDPLRPHIKPYWNDWKKASKADDGDKRAMDRVYTEPEEPGQKVSAETVERENLSHQVHAGRGARYDHNITRPKYIDSMRHPYAVFVFKYRSAGKQAPTIHNTFFFF